MSYLGLIIGYLIIIFTPVAGKWNKVLPQLGRRSKDAWIPFYGYISVLKGCKLPAYWVIFLLMPGIQFIMWACINVSYIRKFGVFEWKQTVLGILFPFPIFWKIAKQPEVFKVVPPTNWDIAKQVDMRTASDHVALFFALPVIGNAIVYLWGLGGFKRKAGKKSIVKEWGDAILFAVIAASAIRTYIFENYKIPTGSMEKTLLIGDHLFVEKLTYGPRVPMTPFSYPVVHNSFAPLINIPSYLNIQKIPYTRLPGFGGIDRYDVTVFNFPAGDTAINDPRMPDGLIGHNYHEILRDEAWLIAFKNGTSPSAFEQNKSYYLNKAREQFAAGKVRCRLVRDEDRKLQYTATSGLLYRPVDKRENYIKRCVGVPGDLIEVVDKALFVNNELSYQGPWMQTKYSLIGTRWSDLTKGDDVDFRKDFDASFLRGDCDADDSGFVTIPMTQKKFEEKKAEFPNLVPYIKKKGYYHNTLMENFSKGQYFNYFPIFPNDPSYDWTEDNFGPLRIPSKGDVVEINRETIPIYRRIITAYEGHTLEEKSDGIYIDGEISTTYTIQQNYYWLMGDNRNSSADSRFWGFVPEDHVVGRASFIWLSVDQEKGMFGGGTRWGRMFSAIK